MGVRLVALSALLAGLSMLTTGVATADTGSSMPAMPGMSTDTPEASTHPMPSLSSAIERSKQRAVFLQATLSGANEVQVQGQPKVGDPDGSATGVVEIQGDKVTFAFSWKGISAPTLGHIHQGAAGVNGEVKVPLFTTPMPDNVTAAAGSVTITDPAVADALRGNPANFYLNLHSKEFPGGAVRGQLAPVRNRIDVLDLLHGGGEHAFLSGRQEVQVAGQPPVGDPRAVAVGFIRPSGTQVSFAFAWLGLQPTLAHIHKAPIGANGPVVVPLVGSSLPANIFAVSGTVNNVDPALVADIAHHPLAYYANLHSAQFPGGAVRGQLF